MVSLWCKGVRGPNSYEKSDMPECNDKRGRRVGQGVGETASPGIEGRACSFGGGVGVVGIRRILSWV